MSKIQFMEEIQEICELQIAFGHFVDTVFDTEARSLVITSMRSSSEIIGRIMIRTADQARDIVIRALQAVEVGTFTDTERKRLFDLPEIQWWTVWATTSPMNAS